MPYVAPLKDMLFVLNELAGIKQIAKLPGCEDATAETVETVLQEHAKFCSEILAPLNRSGDVEPGFLHDGQVTTSKGFKQAFKAFIEAGWLGIQHPAQFGGQGLPKSMAVPCTEMLNSSNLSFALCPLLSDAVIEALMTVGTSEQQQTYVENLVSGKWTGTMNLTEPQAGSDLALIRTRAVPQGDGTFRLFGTKIFISYGEHDMAENIIHLVLARTPGAPEGVKGISLFIVPKFLPKHDGTLGARNDVHCVSLEHKLGIKASPTAVLQYGDHGGAVGTLIGAENRGLEYMFIMMNAARFGVGIQGIGVAERAYQKAVAFAKDRVQSRDLPGNSANAVTIIHHPDVRRMLLSMRAQIEAARALAYVAAAARDIGHAHPDATTRKENQTFYEYLVPIIKGWSTEMAIDVASTGIQVHGGMGFIEETGAAQYYRDVRVLAIYEGTTAIQANDLLSRKTAHDGGAVAKAIGTQVRRTQEQLAASTHTDLIAISKQLACAVTALEQVVNYVVSNMQTDVKGVFSGGVLYLKLAGTVLGGWQLGRAALAANEKLQMLQTHRGEPGFDAGFYQAKISTARFFADHFLAYAGGYRTAIVEGSASVMALEEEQF